MLQHSFVLDSLGDTAPDTMSHFEQLIEEHRMTTTLLLPQSNKEKLITPNPISRLKQIVPTVGVFHTHLPLRRAFLQYDEKYKVTSRRHVCLSFNEIRQILNLAQVMALCEDEPVGTPRGVSMSSNNNTTNNSLANASQITKVNWIDSSSLENHHSSSSSSTSTPTITTKKQAMCNAPSPAPPLPPHLTPRPYTGPKLITFDGDQTLYTDGSNFDSNPKLAKSLTLLLQNKVTVAVVTAAGYDYQAEKYEFRLTGLLAFFKESGLTEEECKRFYIFGGECNFLLNLGADFRLHAVTEQGPGGWLTSTKHLIESPANWSESSVTRLLDVAEESLKESVEQQNLRGRVIRKRRAVGLIPDPMGSSMSRESLDETVLRVQSVLYENSVSFRNLPYCAFNGGTDAWVDVGNKRVGVSVLQAYLGLQPKHCLHVGDQFLNTGNDFAARDCAPCTWITSPEETTFILKRLLAFGGGIDIDEELEKDGKTGTRGKSPNNRAGSSSSFGSENANDTHMSSPRNVPPPTEMHRRQSGEGASSLKIPTKQCFNPYTGEIILPDGPERKKGKR